MFNIFKKFFSKEEEDDQDEFDDIVVPPYKDIKKHFETVGTPENEIGFDENTTLINEIKSKIQPGRKNIFILDDVCDIVDILKSELEYALESDGNLEKANIITICKKSVGFDMLSILINHPDISIDYLITDITFGGNKKINGKNTIIDGVDVLVIIEETKQMSDYVIFTGNILSEANVKNYNFALKFHKYMGENILKHTKIKDSINNLSDEIAFFDKILEDL